LDLLPELVALTGVTRDFVGLPCLRVAGQGQLASKMFAFRRRPLALVGQVLVLGQQRLFDYLQPGDLCV
jgi:hypothetical protein